MASFKELLQNSKSRVLGILLGVVAVAFVGFIYFSGEGTDSGKGSAKLSSVPGNVGYQPGSKNLSKAYLSTLLKSDENTAKQALQRGKSALPTYVHQEDTSALSGQSLQSSNFSQYCQKCCVNCYQGEGGVPPGESTTDLLSKWTKEGNISPLTAAELNKLAEQGASVDDYAARLSQLVKEGKLTPEQARKLLEAYRQAHPEAAKKGSAATNDLLNQMLADGSISPDTVKELKNLADQGLSPDDYAARLHQLVKEGKLTPEQAKKLLEAYRRDHAGMPESKKLSPNDMLNQMLDDGSVSPEVASQLKDLANSGVSVGDYAARLNQLVKEGKLTPEQAKKLLAAYRNQRAKSPEKPTAEQLLDDMLSQGKISPEVAAKLKDLANQGLSPSDYAARLSQLVKEGKLTPEQARKLLAAYRQGQKRVGNADAANSLVDQMLAGGSVSPETAKRLKDLADQGLSVGDYAARLQQLVKEGKLTPEQARKLLAAYRKENTDKGITSTPPSTNDLVSRMLSDGSVSPETAKQLKDLAGQNLSADDYAAKLQQLVREGKLTPEQAKQLLNAYKREHPERAGASPQELVNDLLKSGEISSDVAKSLNDLDAANVPASQYAAELARLVREGKLTPEQAKKLLAAYRAKHGDVSVQGTGQLAELQRVQQRQELQRQMQALHDEAQRKEEMKQAAKTAQTQDSTQAAVSAINSQVGQLITSWNVTPQTVVKGSFADEEEDEKGGTAGSGAKAGVAGKDGNVAAVNAAMIKSGTIMFAVLDTAVNSDQPGPIMATIVSGDFKGGKLIGGLAQTTDGQRVTLTFNSFSMPIWPNTISINAVAINPDTARTAIASSVDNHYLLRYGSVFASSFISGYSKAVMSSGSTTTNDSGGTTTKSNLLGPKEKIMVGIGEIGNKLSTAATSYFNKKPTVRVDSGVGLGILFLADISKPKGVE